MSFDREVKTSLFNILSHVLFAADCGYYDDVLMCDFGLLTGWVSDDEIEHYITESMSEGYSQEDYDEWLERITEWRDKYCEPVVC
jgi:hypothetical protein